MSSRRGDGEQDPPPHICDTPGCLIPGEEDVVPEAATPCYTAEDDARVADELDRLTLDPDRADDVHELLAALPAHQRAAATALLDLGDHPVPLPGHSIVSLPAARVLALLIDGRLHADQVSQYLRAHRLVRPG